MPLKTTAWDAKPAQCSASNSFKLGMPAGCTTCHVTNSSPQNILNLWSRLQLYSSLFTARCHDAAHHTSTCYS